MDKIIALLQRHLWATLTFLVGILAGLIIALPLIPWSLPDSTASLLGSALGAAIAVAGAAIVSERDKKREDEQASEYLESLLAMACERLDSLHFALHCAVGSAALDVADTSMLNWLKSSAQSIRSHIERTMPSLTAIRSFAHRVGVEKMTQIDDSEKLLYQADTIALELISIEMHEYANENALRDYSAQINNIRRGLDTCIDIFSGGRHLRRIRSRKVWGTVVHIE